MSRSRKEASYDRAAVGKRIQTKRMLLDISQDELAERINRQTIDMYAALHVLGQYKENERTYAVRLLNLFLAAMRDITPDETSES